MAPERTGRRWWLLVLAGSVQLMLVLDNTIVNVALPAAQAELELGSAGRQWVVTAYTLSFGCLLLLGGRLRDRFGRRKALVAGLVGFAVASAVGGAATGAGMLVAARAVQGGFAALLAPSVLALMTETFPGGRVRSVAFGVFSVITGSGAAIGLVVGGVLTEFVDWRATMYVNVVFAALAITGVALLVGRDTHTARPRIDLLGTLTVAAGLFGVIFGLSRVEGGQWASPVVLGSMVAGVVLLAVFVLLQHVVRVPLLPLRILRDRDRAGAYLARFTASIGNFAIVLLMTFFLQENLGLSPVLAGVAIVPMVVGIMLGANVAVVLSTPRTRAQSVVGLLASALALWWLSGLSMTTSYWSDVMAQLLLFGIGQGLAINAATNRATRDLPAGDTGVASAFLNVMQQIGGTVGVALLSSVASGAAATATAAGTDGLAATVHGYDIAFLTAAGIFAVTALACGLLFSPASGVSGLVGRGRRP